MHPQARYWLLTIPHADFLPYKPNSVTYIRGQLERGESTGYLHWQILVVFTSKCRLRGVQSVFGRSIHAEPSRSSAATDYVWKRDTSVDGTQFELGTRIRNRSNANDWTAIRDDARRGRLDDIPGDVYVRCYNQLRRIAADHTQPVATIRTVYVFWGASGTGKTKRAWAEAGPSAYCKDPLSKFWCGYQGETNVIIDEFRGGINISHILRWLDRYPCRIELKGASAALLAENIWITSNRAIEDWYDDLDAPTLAALKRRMTEVVYFPSE